MYFDSHSHIQFPDYEEDLPEVIERALKAEVEGIIVVGTTIDDSQQAIALARQYPELYAAVGIHPSDTDDVNDELIDMLTLLLEQPSVVAIGEVGLDYYRSEVAQEQQKRVMTRFIRFARELGKPIIIHQRSAEEDLYQIVRDEGGGEVSGVMHCFSGDVKMAAQMLDLGFYISFAGNISFKNFKQQEVIREVPLEKLLLETDAPFLSPEPYRGKRNEPAHLHYTVEAAAKILGLSPKDVARETTGNAKRLFGIDGANS